MSKTVADIMVPAPIVAEVPGTRNDVINLMVRHKLTGVPVVRSSDGKLMGVVSRKDIFRNFEEDQLSLIMKKAYISISPDATIEEAARVFYENRIHRLPVVDNGMLVGIVTPTDLLKIIKDTKTRFVASDAIRTTCVTAFEEDPLSYTIAAMRISDVTALPVLDAKGTMTGIITDRDLFNDQMKDPTVLKELGIPEGDNLAGYRNVLPLFYVTTDKYNDINGKVKDYMIKKPISIFKKTSLQEVAKIMISNDFGQLPVYGNKDELEGMIYDLDVLIALLE